jgi:Domain of unknown function (DUF4232)
MAGGTVLACAVTVVAACGSSSSSTGSATATAASDPSAPSTSAVPASSAPAASPASSAGGTAGPSPGAAGTWSGYSGCRDLQVTLGLSQRDPSVTYQVIDFTNRSRVICTLYGYPGVSLAAGTVPTPVGFPAAHDPSATPKLITLRPGAVANALLQIPEAVNGCGPARADRLIVARPNGASPVKLAFAAAACAKRDQMMKISAVSLGAGG